MAAAAQARSVRRPNSPHCPDFDPASAMFWKRSGALISISADGHGEFFSFGAGELADIRYACAWPGSGVGLLTAARTSTDRASVRENHGGNYRAYRASARGIERCSDEYTNTAIPLPDNRGIAYSNGTSLVVIIDGERRAYKVGQIRGRPHRGGR